MLRFQFDEPDIVEHVVGPLAPDAMRPGSRSESHSGSRMEPEFKVPNRRWSFNSNDSFSRSCENGGAVMTSTPRKHSGSDNSSRVDASRPLGDSMRRSEGANSMSVNGHSHWVRPPQMKPQAHIYTVSGQQNARRLLPFPPPPGLPPSTCDIAINGHGIATISLEDREHSKLPAGYGASMPMRVSVHPLPHIGNGEYVPTILSPNASHGYTHVVAERSVFLPKPTQSQQMERVGSGRISPKRAHSDDDRQPSSRSDDGLWDYLGCQDGDHRWGPGAKRNFQMIHNSHGMSDNSNGPINSSTPMNHPYQMHIPQPQMVDGNNDVQVHSQRHQAEPHEEQHREHQEFEDQHPLTHQQMQATQHHHTNNIQYQKMQTPPCPVMQQQTQAAEHHLHNNCNYQNMPQQVQGGCNAVPYQYTNRSDNRPFPNHHYQKERFNQEKTHQHPHTRYDFRNGQMPPPHGYGHVGKQQSNHHHRTILPNPFHHHGNMISHHVPQQQFDSRMQNSMAIGYSHPQDHQNVTVDLTQDSVSPPPSVNSSSFHREQHIQLEQDTASSCANLSTVVNDSDTASAQISEDDDDTMKDRKPPIKPYVPPSLRGSAVDPTPVEHSTHREEREPRGAEQLRKATEEAMKKLDAKGTPHGNSNSSPNNRNSIKIEQHEVSAEIRHLDVGTLGGRGADANTCASPFLVSTKVGSVSAKDGQKSSNGTWERGVHPNKSGPHGKGRQSPDQLSDEPLRKHRPMDAKLAHVDTKDKDTRSVVSGKSSRFGQPGCCEDDVKDIDKSTMHSNNGSTVSFIGPVMPSKSAAQITRIKPETITSPRSSKNFALNGSEQLESLLYGSSEVFYDSHCHLDFIYNKSRDYGNLAQWRLNYPQSFPTNFGGCIPNFIDPALFCEGLDPAKYDLDWVEMQVKDKGAGVLGASYGIHPHSADDYSPAVIEQIEDFAKWPLRFGMIAIGECGLDFHRCTSSVESQERAFIAQIQLAVRKNLPLIIHCRSGREKDAEIPCLGLLQKHMGRFHNVHRHCYTGDYETAVKWMEMFPNVYFGYTNVVAGWSEHSKERDAFRRIPLDRILLETDAPYFKPRAFDGSKRISPPGCALPGMAIAVAHQLAADRNLTVDEVLKQTRRNTEKMYCLEV